MRQVRARDSPPMPAVSSPPGSSWPGVPALPAGLRGVRPQDVRASAYLLRAPWIAGVFAVNDDGTELFWGCLWGLALEALLFAGAYGLLRFLLS